MRSSCALMRGRPPATSHLAALQSHERRHGVLAEGSLEGRQNADQAAQIGREEFEAVCAAAGRHVAGRTDVAFSDSRMESSKLSICPGRELMRMDDVTRVAETLLDAYESQLRALVPLELPWGAVVERDGPLVRTHYGTHATVHHAALRDDLAGLIRRQQELFAARCEPVEWKVYSHDAPLLGESLRAAGFVPGPERTLLMADIAKVPSPEDLPPGMRIRPHLPGERERLRRRAAVVPEQRRPLSELEADGTAPRDRIGDGDPAAGV